MRSVKTWKTSLVSFLLGVAIAFYAYASLNAEAGLARPEASRPVCAPAGVAAPAIESPSNEIHDHLQLG